MGEDNQLQRKAREAIQARKMPRRYPERLWGGPGTGARCTVCDEPVGSDDIEFELEFPPGDDQPGRGNPRVHTRCLSEWESACRELEPAQRTARAGLEAPPSAGAAAGSAPKPN